MISRRDFLKLSGLAPLSLASRRLLNGLAPSGAPQNVLILVFDAFSAYNMSLYGYARETTPNISRLAERAIVYHTHHAAGDYTTPGTASLLTGVWPWTHRALQHDAEVNEAHRRHTIFDAFKGYYRIAFTHNLWAQTLLRQFDESIDQLVRRQQLLLPSKESFISGLFPNDEDLVNVSWFREGRLDDDGFAYSLFLSQVVQALPDTPGLKQLKLEFPRGLPGSHQNGYFLLEQGVDWLARQIVRLPEPFLGYFHFLPPHEPYTAPLEFFNAFKGDGYVAEKKPRDVLATTEVPDVVLGRRQYDEFILYVDREFERLYRALEVSGLLANTWVVLTSDHGETFERGFLGHETPILYEPVIRVPLLIFEPGRTERVDIREATSAVDLLPTLASIMGQEIPEWSEGVVMPPFMDTGSSSGRGSYVVQASTTGRQAPITRGSTVLIKDDYKLHYYFGRPELGGGDSVRLYNIRADPEEMEDLAASQKGIAEELLGDLKAALAEANRPYV